MDQFQAAKNDDLQWFLDQESSIDLNAVNDAAETSLSIAAANGYLELVKYCIDNGATIRMPGNLIFIETVCNGHVDVLQFLVENIESHLMPWDGLIVYAASEGHADVVRYLIENNVDVREHESIAVTYASMNDHYDVVKQLIVAGADPLRINMTNSRHFLEIAECILETCTGIDVKTLDLSAQFRQEFTKKIRRDSSELRKSLQLDLLNTLSLQQIEYLVGCPACRGHTAIDTSEQIIVRRL